jgi:UDP-N-acetylmuramoylalanine--D-glutamate ligase
MNVQGKHVLVVGLARSGLSVAHALARRGAVVTVTDRKPPAQFCDVLPQLLKDKVGLELGLQRTETFLAHEMIVISPGVPWDLPQLQAARDKGIPVYPEVEAASWFLEGTLVGITGSNGKTTTTALLGDMLKASGFPTFVGGNIGNALSSAVDHALPGTKFVTELSSFQLEGIHDFDPHVAVMLNLSPNHLDRHPNLEAYAQAKRQIFRNQRGQDYAVLNADDPWVAGLQATVPSRPVLFSRQRELPSGVFVSAGKIYYRVRHLERVLFETRDVNLRGDFNLEDVLAATTAACVLGADFAAIRQAVRAFQAVEHRLEFVREVEGVDFYNNSKATSVDATLKSLGAFERGVHLIMGGKDKGAPYTPLLPFIKDRVREILLIGAAAPVIAKQLAGSTELVLAGDLSSAVYEAFTRSRPGDTVLLAPACSSFDQFKDFEERGRVFKELVKQLADDVAAGKVARSKPPVVVVPEPPPVETLAPEPSPKPAPVPPAAPREEPVAAESPRPLAPAPVAAVEPPPPTRAPVAAAQPPRSPARASVAEQMLWEDLTEALARAMEPPPAPTAQVAEVPPSEIASGERSAPQPVAETSPPPVESAEEHAETPADSAGAFRDTGYGTRDTGDAVRESASAQSVNPESLLPSPEPPTPSPEPAASSSESEVPIPESRIPSPVSRVPLTYVYEVDAVEMPEMESQVAPEDEPAISISASLPETLDDEVLPFEVRKKDSGVRSPESGVETQSEDQGTKSEAPPAPRQPKLFDGSDE